MKLLAPKDLYATTGPSSVRLKKGELRIIGQTLGLKAVEAGAIDVSHMNDEEIAALAAVFTKSTTEAFTEELEKIEETTPPTIEETEEPLEEDEDSDKVVETESTHVSELLDSLKMKASDAEDVTIDAIPEELVEVVNAMEKIVARNNMNDFRDDGQPKATLVNREVGRIISSEDRSTAWEIVAKRVGRK